MIKTFRCKVERRNGIGRSQGIRPPVYRFGSQLSYLSHLHMCGEAGTPNKLCAVGESSVPDLRNLQF